MLLGYITIYIYPKCNNYLVSFVFKVEGLFVPYIVVIFDTIKSRTMVYRYIVDDIFEFLALEP